MQSVASEMWKLIFHPMMISDKIIFPYYDYLFFREIIWLWITIGEYFKFFELSINQIFISFNYNGKSVFLPKDWRYCQQWY